MDMPSRQGHSGHDHDHPHAGHSHGHGYADTKAVAGLNDPVCGMTVTEQSPHHVEHQDQLYYFCSAVAAKHRLSQYIVVLIDHGGNMQVLVRVDTANYVRGFVRTIIHG